jgi:hypothetical protein
MPVKRDRTDGRGRPKSNARAWRRLRRAVQIVALLLFLALFVYSTAQRHNAFGPIPFPAGPLLMLSASLSGRLLVGGFFLAVSPCATLSSDGSGAAGSARWALLEWLSPRRACRHGLPTVGAPSEVVTFVLPLPPSWATCHSPFWIRSRS